MVSRITQMGNGNSRRKAVSPLRQRMIEDMQLAGLSANTQQRYIEAVIRLQNATGVRPDRLTEADVRRYLINMREVDRVAKGTFQINFYGLKFFFYRVLDYDWSLFLKKKLPCRDRSVFLWHCVLTTAAA